MGQIHLPIVALKQICHGSLQDTRLSSGKTRGMFSAREPQAAGLNADHFYLLVPDECMEESYGIAAPADAGNQAIRQPAFCSKNLPPGFTSDDGLEIPDHHRIGMGSEHRTEYVVGCADIRRPIPHGLADGVLERAASRVDPSDGCTEQSHAEHVQCLALHGFGPHITSPLKPAH